MARKGERYQQVPTLWYLGTGYPCRVVRRRRVVSERTGKRVWRWESRDHAVLTATSLHRWLRLEDQGKVDVWADRDYAAVIQSGILPKPKRREWAL